MSVQGLQRTQQLLNVIAQQLPSIAQASETPNISLNAFINGALARSGVQLDPALAGVTTALVALIGQPTDATPYEPLVPRQDDTGA